MKLLKIPEASALILPTIIDWEEDLTLYDEKDEEAYNVLEKYIEELKQKNKTLYDELNEDQIMELIGLYSTITHDYYDYSDYDVKSDTLLYLTGNPCDHGNLVKIRNEWEKYCKFDNIVKDKEHYYPLFDINSKFVENSEASYFYKDEDNNIEFVNVVFENGRDLCIEKEYGIKNLNEKEFRELLENNYFKDGDIDYICKNEWEEINKFINCKEISKER